MFEKLISDEISALVPYPPGKPLEELERELGISGAIKLASNENPFGPSPLAKQALSAAIDNLHRYPDGSGYYLKKALAQKLGLDMNQIVLGNGSNEIIELAVRTFMGPGKGAVFSDPTFLVYSKVVQGAGGKFTRIPLNNLRHDLNGLAKAVDDDTRLLFLDNPNNPTGSLVNADDLRRFMKDLPRTTVLILDEAYRDFVRQREQVEPAEWIEGDRPVIALRTFSKVYGLAGLRIGYGLAHRELINYIDRVRQPFNVNTLAQVGALAALEDLEFHKKTIEATWAGMDWLGVELEKMGLKYFPSQTNFFMIETKRPASEVSNLMLREGVIVRSLASYGLENIIRINVGLTEENQRFITALKKVLAS